MQSVFACEIFVLSIFNEKCFPPYRKIGEVPGETYKVPGISPAFPLQINA